MSNNNLTRARECCLRENNLCGKTKSCLWDGFCDTAVDYDRTGCITDEWNTFPIGTPRANIVDWFYNTFEVDIDALKEMTGRYINTDSGDSRQKSIYEKYAEQVTSEDMERFSRLFKRPAKRNI